jgi:putative endonuclease
MTNQSIGQLGEELAYEYLIKNGFTILHRNFRTRFGELDIIGKKGNKIHFIEVKTRVGLQKGMPYEAVTYHKVNHLRFAVMGYIKMHKLQNYLHSFDVVSIILNTDLSVESLKFFENVGM